MPENVSAELGRWVIRADPGETFIYGHAYPGYPDASAMHAAWTLKELGLVRLHQRREPDKRMAYLCIRTAKVHEDAHLYQRKNTAAKTTQRALTSEQVQDYRAAWRLGMELPEVANRLNVSFFTVKKMLLGYAYAEIPGAITEAEWAARRRSNAA